MGIQEFFFEESFFTIFLEKKEKLLYGTIIISYYNGCKLIRSLIMTIEQNIFPFKLEMEKKDTLTNLAGLPLFNEVFKHLDLKKFIEKNIHLKEKGWRDSICIETLLALIISGGEHLSDVEILRQDKAYQRLIKKKTGLPDEHTLGRYLKYYHREVLKPKNKDAWIPNETAQLRRLQKLLKHLVRKIIKKKKRIIKTFTVEVDATVIESHKREAEYSYKSVPGYQPTIGIISELGIVIHDEFRDGNVPAAYRVLSFIKNCIKLIPKDVKRQFRADGACYQHCVMEYLEKEKIAYAISAEKSKNLISWIEKIEEDKWKPYLRKTKDGMIDTGCLCASIDWSPTTDSQKQLDKKLRRYVIKKKPVYQDDLFDCEESIKDRYDLVVTNLDWDESKVLDFHYTLLW